MSWLSWHALSHFFGLDNASGGQYLFWSGIGSDLTYLAVVGVAWRHLNCNAKGCWRFGVHAVEGTGHKVCRTHHPVLAGKKTKTAEEIGHMLHTQTAKGGK